MVKLNEFLSGVKILEKIDSPINGLITVEKSLAWGTYITAGGLTQSGGIIKDIWKKPLKIVKSEKLKVKNCLILGLGGGTVVGMVRKMWPTGAGKPEIKITGVDIDPKIVGLGKKYLGLDKTEIETVIGDAFQYLKKSKTQKNQKSKYDLILVDLYCGDNFPEKFESENYIHLVRSVLARGGTAIFNRLYYGEKRAQAMKFEQKLEKVFGKVDIVFPEANVMFICSK